MATKRYNCIKIPILLPKRSLRLGSLPKNFLEIFICTSVQPMFGDPAAPGAAWDQPFWTPPRDSASAPGLASAEWA